MSEFAIMLFESRIRQLSDTELSNLEERGFLNFDEYYAIIDEWTRRRLLREQSKPEIKWQTLGF